MTHINCVILPRPPRSFSWKLDDRWFRHALAWSTSLAIWDSSISTVDYFTTNTTVWSTLNDFSFPLFLCHFLRRISSFAQRGRKAVLEKKSIYYYCWVFLACQQPRLTIIDDCCLLCQIMQGCNRLLIHGQWAWIGHVGLGLGPETRSYRSIISGSWEKLFWFFFKPKQVEESQMIRP